MMFARHGRQSVDEVERWPMRNFWQRWETLREILENEAPDD